MSILVPVTPGDNISFDVIDEGFEGVTITAPVAFVAKNQYFISFFIDIKGVELRNKKTQYSYLVAGRARLSHCIKAEETRLHFDFVDIDGDELCANCETTYPKTCN